MRVLVIGAGRMGEIRATDLAVDKRVAEVVITNRTARKACEVASRLGIQDIDWRLLAEVEVDAYVMAAATDAHGELLDLLLERRAPLLCEKPIAVTIKETEQICLRAERLGTAMQIGFQRRFDAGIARARQAVVDGEIGDLYDLVLASRDHTPPSREFIEGSGGIFRDLHVHDLDLVGWITGSPIATVQATRAVRGAGAYAEYDDADITRIIAVTESGVLASISGARHDARGHDVRLEVFGSKDSISAGLTPRTPLRVLDEPAAKLDINPYSGFIDRFRDAFRAETSAFVDLILGGENPCPPHAALDAMRAAVACERSARTGELVHVAEVIDD